MNLKRTAFVGVSGGALVVWIAAAATSPSRPVLTAPTVRSTAIDASGAELAAEIARLHDRLRPTVPPMQARDLFRYASKGLAMRARPIDATPVEAVAPAVPPLRLIGIAEDPGDAGPVRTAIISTPGGVSLVKEGETVLSHYRVTKVSSDSVDLVDADDSVLRLPLP